MLSLYGAASDGQLWARAGEGKLTACDDFGLPTGFAGVDATTSTPAPEWCRPEGCDVAFMTFAPVFDSDTSVTLRANVAPAAILRSARTLGVPAPSLELYYGCGPEQPHRGRLCYTLEYAAVYAAGMWLSRPDLFPPTCNDDVDCWAGRRGCVSGTCVYRAAWVELEVDIGGRRWSPNSPVSPTPIPGFGGRDGWLTQTKPNGANDTASRVYRLWSDPKDSNQYGVNHQTRVFFAGTELAPGGVGTAWVGNRLQLLTLALGD